MSNSANSLFDGKLAFVPANEDVLVCKSSECGTVRPLGLRLAAGNIKKGEMLAMLHETGLRSQVTCLARSHSNLDTYAVGYQDGSIRLWSAKSKSVLVTLNGHRKAVTALEFDRDGTRLASGSQDTDIILWDILAESGMFRCARRSP